MRQKVSAEVHCPRQKRRTHHRKPVRLPIHQSVSHGPPFDTSVGLQLRGFVHPREREGPFRLVEVLADVRTRGETKEDNDSEDERGDAFDEEAEEIESSARSRR